MSEQRMNTQWRQHLAEATSASCSGRQPAYPVAEAQLGCQWQQHHLIHLVSQACQNVSSQHMTKPTGNTWEAFHVNVDCQHMEEMQPQYILGHLPLTHNSCLLRSHGSSELLKCNNFADNQMASSRMPCQSVPQVAAHQKTATLSRLSSANLTPGIQATATCNLTKQHDSPISVQFSDWMGSLVTIPLEITPRSLTLSFFSARSCKTCKTSVDLELQEASSFQTT